MNNAHQTIKEINPKGKLKPEHQVWVTFALDKCKPASAPITLLYTSQDNSEKLSLRFEAPHP